MTSVGVTRNTTARLGCRVAVPAKHSSAIRLRLETTALPGYLVNKYQEEQMSSVTAPQMTGARTSLLKRASTELMFEMDKLFPDRRFVWR